MAISEKNIQLKIFRRLKDGLEGVYDFEIELEKRFNESPSKIKKIKPPIRAYIDNDTSDDFSVLEVNCKNAPGVLFKKFGGGLDKETVYDQGFHIIAPWNTMHVYDVRFKDTFEKMEVLSKNGLSIKFDLSFRYQPVARQIGYLDDNIAITNPYCTYYRSYYLSKC